MTSHTAEGMDDESTIAWKPADSAPAYAAFAAAPVASPREPASREVTLVMAPPGTSVSPDGVRPRTASPAPRGEPRRYTSFGLTMLEVVVGAVGILTFGVVLAVLWVQLT